MQFRPVYPRQFKTQKSRFFMLLFSSFFILKSYAGVNYAEGLVPSIAIDIATRTIVETHVEDDCKYYNPNGKLYLKVGTIDANNNINWQQPENQYEVGGHPKVASLGEGRFVEVHEDQYQDKNTGDYQIWVTYGTVSNNTFHKDSYYGALGIRGQKPSVAYLGNDKVIVVYSRNDNGHPWQSLYYTIYQLNNGHIKPIDAATNVQYETSGTTPSITMLGKTIIETHIGDPAPYTNSLFSKVGTFDDSSNTISWNPSNFYTSVGFNSNHSIVKIGDDAIAETHYGESNTIFELDDDIWDIWSAIGTLSSDGKSINWANYQKFDSGTGFSYNPNKYIPYFYGGTALASFGSQLLEAHTQVQDLGKRTQTVHMYIDTGSITQDSGGNYNINWGLNSSKNLRSNQQKGRASILPW